MTRIRASRRRAASSRSAVARDRISRTIRPTHISPNHRAARWRASACARSSRLWLHRMRHRTKRVVFRGVTPLLLVVALFFGGVLWPLPSATPIVTDHPIAFVGVTVIDVEQGISIPGRTVVIDRGRIAAVVAEEDAVLPARSARIDSRGMYLMPAL